MNSLEVLSAQNGKAIVQQLLQQMFGAFLRFVLSIENKARIECEQRGVSYEGWKSWPEGLRAWQRRKRQTLRTFVRDHKLCRKDIKEAITRAKAEIAKEK